MLAFNLKLRYTLHKNTKVTLTPDTFYKTKVANIEKNYNKEPEVEGMRLNNKQR